MNLKKFFKNKKQRTVLIIIFILVLLLVLLTSSGSRAKDEENKIETVEVTRQDLSSLVSASGQIEAGEKAEVRFQTSGQLVWVGVGEGDTVKKWQALASLDKRELQKRLENQLNNFSIQRLTFDQTNEDYQEDKDNAVITDEIQRILDKAQLSLNNEIIDVELADLAIKYATIYSPIDGVVTSIDSPLPGVNITPAQATFTIINPNSLYFSLEVDETEVVFLSEGQEAKVFLDAFPDQTFSAQIDQIGFTPLSGQGTKYPVKLKLIDPDPSFRLGMSGEAEILIEKKDQVLAVPESALLKREEAYSVFRIVDGKAQKQVVEIGLITDDGVEIVSGLNQGDEIVSSGVSQINDGQKI